MQRKHEERSDSFAEKRSLPPAEGDDAGRSQVDSQAASDTDTVRKRH